MADPQVSVDEIAAGLLRTGGPMCFDEVLHELTILRRSVHTALPQITARLVSTTLEALTAAGSARCEAGQWRWLPPSDKTQPRQATLF